MRNVANNGKPPVFGKRSPIIRNNMVSFIGQYEAKVDDKGRLVFPAGFKSLLPPGEGNQRFVIKKNIFEDCLEMYTCEEWGRQSEELKKKVNFLKKEHAAFWRKYMRDCAQVVTKEVVFSGNDYKIEIWAKDKFAASEISDEEYLNIAEALSDLG